MTTLYAAYTRDRKLLTITDNADSIPPDVSRIAFFPTNTPELTAMQLSFSAFAYGLEYDVQTGHAEKMVGGL